MSNAPKNPPEDYHTITSSLVIKGAKKAIEFYQAAFGATVIHLMEMPDGSVMHAEMRVGDSRFMLSDEMPDWGVLSPQTLGGTPVGLYMYVADCDASFQKAIAAGAVEQRPPTTEFWGDRMGQVLDPFGHKWTFATRIEDVSPEEMKRRGDEWLKQMGA